MDCSKTDPYETRNHRILENWVEAAVAPVEADESIKDNR